MGFKLKTAPTEEPVTLAEAKVQCHMDADITAEDELLNLYIKAARKHVEAVTRRPLITQTWTWYGDCFDGDIELKPNLRSITSIKYIDTDGNQQTIDDANYKADTVEVVGVAYPAYGYSWPYARNVTNAIEVEFSAGYGDAADVPEEIKQAMLLMIGHWYQNRESVTVGVSLTETPQGSDMLIGPYKVISF